MKIHKELPISLLITAILISIGVVMLSYYQFVEAHSDIIIILEYVLIILTISFSIACYSLINKLIIPFMLMRKNLVELSKDEVDGDEIKKISRFNEEVSTSFNSINDRLKANNELRNITQEQLETLELQRSVINATATAMIVTDVRQHGQPIIFINQAFTLLTGYTPEEVLGKDCTLLHGEKTEIAKTKYIAEAVNAGKTCSVVITNYTKSGKAFLNSLTIDPVYNNNSEITHYIAVQNDITEAKRKEKEVLDDLTQIVNERTKETEETANRLRAVFDTALDGTIVIDETGYVLDVNSALESIVGRNKHELLNQHVSLILTSLDFNQQGMRTSFSKWLAMFIGKPEKLYALHASENVIPIEMSVGETNIQGKAMYVAVIRDITSQQENKQREIELQTKLYEQELIYRTAFNQAAVGIARIGIKSEFVEVNNKLCEILQFNEKELCKLHVKDVTYDSDIEKSTNYIQMLLSGEIQNYNIDKRYIKKDKSIFWANVSISLVRDNYSNDPKFFIAVIEDITERKDFEQTLSNINKEREVLLAGLNIASKAAGVYHWSFDIISNQLTWDEGMRTLYGVELDQDIYYDNWRNALHPDDLEKAESDVMAAIEAICSFKSEFRIINPKTKEQHWIQCAANVAVDENKTPVIMYGINIDITQEKINNFNLEKETKSAKQASEAKSRFLATMSHEIRTPMNGVIGMIDLLRDTQLNSDQNRMAATIKDSAFSLLDIINDILDFSKIESGQLELELTPTNILTVIEKTIDSLWINASNKNVELLIHPDLSIPEKLNLDSVRVRQIVLNLLGNAIKFTGQDRDGLVIIRLNFDYEDSTLSIEVIDNGLGISKDQQQKLFKPFIQADSSTTRKFGGTGLGLSISKSFTELMGGKISVESELNSGSCFRVSLPVMVTPNSINEFENFDFSQYSIYIALSSNALTNCCYDIFSQFDTELVRCVPADKINELYEQGDNRTVIITNALEAKALVNVESIKTLLLDADPIRRKGHLDPSTFVVGAHPLKPSDLIHGLAVLCGLESPLLNWSVEEPVKKTVKKMSVEEAETTNQLILIAEDQPTNRLVLSKQLENLGYACEMAVDGVEALKMWRTGRYRLLLTDCHMPNMDGLELTRCIRKIEKEKDLISKTIIAVTANALVGESDKCLDAGMNDYIAKPVEITTLKKVLAQYLPIEHDDIINSKPESLPTEVIENQPIDYEHLKTVIGTDDVEITDEILLMYWQSVNEDYQLLKQAVNSSKTEEVRGRAHASKGASVSSGAMFIGKIFLWIEKNNTDLDGIKDRFSDIDTELANIEQALVIRGVL
ncbi:PAS domain-containing hybrid sensor histidine kinase/response regulator [Shewanella donghaensis]|uniref:PAS domain-containing hybrid sensor histidine kinase/response regulator n=1 Tax=Shewanella donghaensis TaxID=238836 RepID=UPI0011840C4D|nr:PAS domain S-box protein [Shewanella donghaensis]